MRNIKNFFVAAIAFVFLTAATPLGGGYPNLVFWGDSLTASSGSSGGVTTTYPYITANSGARGRWFYQGGVGAQTSTQIAVRQGGLATTATILGGQIPTSGGVTVSFPTGFEPATSQGPSNMNGTNAIYGTISGVYGTVSLSGAVYTFTRSVAGSVVNVASAQFFPETSFATNGTAIIWAGRNGAASGSSVPVDIAAMVANTAVGRYLVLNITNSSTEPAGSSVYNQIVALNAALLVTYGNKYVPVREALVAAGCPGGAVPDAAACAGDYPPPGVRSDTIHLNNLGYSIVAATVYAAMQSNGLAANDNIKLLTKAA